MMNNPAVKSPRGVPIYRSGMTETPFPARPDRTLKALWSAILAILLAFHAMPETLSFAPATGESRVTAVAAPGAQYRNGSAPAQIASYRFTQVHRDADSHGGDTPFAAVAPGFAIPLHSSRTPWTIAGHTTATQRAATAYQARAPPAA